MRKTIFPQFKLWLTLLFIFVVSTQVVAADQKERSLTITAHRGASAIAPENTLLAMQRAIESGADFLECDIHLTKDSVVVVCHDTTIDRTTTGVGEIRNMTLQQIKSFDIVDKYGNKTALKIPTLDELLTFVDGRSTVLIEIKQKSKSVGPLEQAMVEVIALHNAQSWVSVQSFSNKSLLVTHALMPELSLEKLFSSRFMGLPPTFNSSFIRVNSKKYSHITSFNIYHRAATRKFVDKIHKMGKKVKLWTIKDRSVAIPDVGADGIITDRPDQWRKCQ